MNRMALLFSAAVVAGIALWYVEGPGDETPAAPAPATVEAHVEPVPAAVTPVAGVAAAAPHADPEEGGTPDQIGRAQLAQGIEAKRDGKTEQALELLHAAAASLAEAIARAGDRPDPWTLQSMAQAQLELGNDVDAVAWADRALQRLRLGDSDDYQAFRAASLTMNVGIVYYRAGQRQTGIAYMDQAISMAPTDFDRADFSDLKQETVGG